MKSQRDVRSIGPAHYTLTPHPALSPLRGEGLTRLAALALRTGFRCNPVFELFALLNISSASHVLRTVNIEAGLPTLDEARRQAVEEIRRAKREGVRVLKVIHGYGSSGKGGTLNHGLRKSFALRKKENVIKDFIPGESFDIFNATVLALLEAVPALRGDPDLGQANLGITIVWLK